jgi:hypothetical protein
MGNNKIDKKFLDLAKRRKSFVEGQNAETTMFVNAYYELEFRDSIPTVVSENVIC